MLKIIILNIIYFQSLLGFADHRRYLNHAVRRKFISPGASGTSSAEGRLSVILDLNRQNTDGNEEFEDVPRNSDGSLLYILQRIIP